MSKSTPWANKVVGTEAWAKAKMADPSMSPGEREYVERIIAEAQAKRIKDAIGAGNAPASEPVKSPIKL